MKLDTLVGKIGQITCVRINEPVEEKSRLIIIGNHISQFVTVDKAVWVAIQVLPY